jgi:hypothetical protein
MNRESAPSTDAISVRRKKQRPQIADSEACQAHRIMSVRTGDTQGPHKSFQANRVVWRFEFSCLFELNRCEILKTGHQSDSSTEMRGQHGYDRR